MGGKKHRLPTRMNPPGGQQEIKQGSPDGSKCSDGEPATGRVNEKEALDDRKRIGSPDARG